MNSPDVSHASRVMPGFPATIAAPVLRRCAPSGVVILFLLLDGAIRLVPWPMVTANMDRLDYGPGECVARLLGAINLICTFQPASFVGAIVTAGYLVRAMISHVEIIGSPFAFVLSGACVGAMLWGGSRLRDRHPPLHG
jgi:DoxX-like family